MARINLLSPWVQYYREVEALFKKDPNVRVLFEENKDNLSLTLYVYGDEDKVSAIQFLFPEKKTFGNVELKIFIKSSNGVVPSEVNWNFDEELFENAFGENEAFSFAVTVSDIFSNPITYVVFKNEVVQYYTDDLGDYNGIRSTLYQEIAKEIFSGVNWVFFCTDKEKEVKNTFYNFDRPLGEWP